MSATLKFPAEAGQPFREIPVLFEDEFLIALDKPPGLPVLPDPAAPDLPALLPMLHGGIAAGKPWARERGLSYLMNIHRLDTEAGGVLLFARSKDMFVRMNNLFSMEQPVREYVALSHGAPIEPRFEVDLKLAPNPSNPALVKIDSARGKRSRTQVELVEQFSNWALFRCRMLTDRQHQLRVHLRHSRLPVVGDALYGGRPLLLSRLKPGYRLKPGKTERPLLSSPALHAVKIAFDHPQTGARVEVESPMPKDFEVALKYLRRYQGKAEGGV
ncbi:MAG: RluA family pseudouridine synthase [Verrucomicrobiota bacterium]